jgi:hypothetical protein
MGKRRTKRQRGPQKKRSRQRTRSKLRLPLAALPTIEEVEDEELAEQEEGEQDAAAEDAEAELLDDADDEDAEDGIVDQFSTIPLDEGPSTASANEIDADDLPPYLDDLPAVTFYREPDGSAAYVLSEYQTARHWEWIDGLACLLIDRANGSWEGLVGLQDARRKVPQKAIMDYVKAQRGPDKSSSSSLKTRKTKKGKDDVADRGLAKSTLADELRTTILSFDGRYIPAISFFRENVDRTQAGRSRARDLLRAGWQPAEAEKRLMDETGAPRTTVKGWVKWAAENLGIDEQGNTT